MLLTLVMVYSNMDWPYFNHSELACKGSDKCEMSDEFMQKIIAVREEFDKPMIITSGYRSPSYNESIGGAEYSPHMYGRAVDVQVYGQDALVLLKTALKHGLTGVGVKQHGEANSRFIHLDDMEASDMHFRPWIWSYS